MTNALETLRAEARNIGRESSLVGWFTRAADEIGSTFFAPVRDVFVATLSWDKDKTFSRFNPPITLSILPVIWHSRKVHIGGNGWRRLGQRQYMRYLSPKESDWSVQLANGRLDTPQPVGWFYLLYDKSGSPYSIGRRADTVTNRAVEMALHLLQWAKDRPNQIGDRQVAMPFLAQACAPRTYLKLRESKELDEKVLSNAQSGLWDFVTSDCAGELHSMFRGKAACSEDGRHITVKSAEEEYSVGLDGSENFLEEAIKANFGKCLKVNLQPAVNSVDGYVQAGQPLVRPVAARDWALEELKALPEWPVLAHLAAFTGAYRHAGSVVFDSDMVEAEQAPWIDARRFPVCTSVLNRPGALRDATSSGEMDLYNVPLRKAAPDVMRKVFRVG